MMVFIIRLTYNHTNTKQPVSVISFFFGLLLFVPINKKSMRNVIQRFKQEVCSQNKLHRGKTLLYSNS